MNTCVSIGACYFSGDKTYELFLLQDILKYHKADEEKMLLLIPTVFLFLWCLPGVRFRAELPATLPSYY